jgi:hypothetical protein
MLNLNLIKEGPNGQLEFDFEALEAVTSKKFVEFVKSEIAFALNANPESQLEYIGFWQERPESSLGKVQLNMSYLLLKIAGHCFYFTYDYNVYSSGKTREDMAVNWMPVGICRKFVDALK